MSAFIAPSDNLLVCSGFYSVYFTVNTILVPHFLGFWWNVLSGLGGAISPPGRRGTVCFPRLRYPNHVQISDPLTSLELDSLVSIDLRSGTRRETDVVSTLS